jgi:CheY-like chemotaxis protein
VVDDHQPFRRVACEAAAATCRFRVVGEAGSGEEAFGVVAATRPDLVLMDVRMPGMGGVEATRRLVRCHPGLVVWLVTADVTTGLGDLADACGAAAVVDKRDMVPRRLRDLWDDGGRPNEAARPAAAPAQSSAGRRPYTARPKMTRMSIVKMASDQNGYAGMNSSWAIAFRPTMKMPVQRAS